MTTNSDAALIIASHQENLRHHLINIVIKNSTDTKFYVDCWTFYSSLLPQNFSPESLLPYRSPCWVDFLPSSDQRRCIVSLLLLLLNTPQRRRLGGGFVWQRHYPVFGLYCSTVCAVVQHSAAVSFPTLLCTGAVSLLLVEQEEKEADRRVCTHTHAHTHTGNTALNGSISDQ